MKKQIITMIALALVSGNAMAHVASGSNNQRTAATGSPMNSATPTAASGTSAVYKEAIVAGQQAAVEVLNGAEASDLFWEARDAAEALLETSFANDLDAARVVITLAEQFQAE